MCVSLVCVLGSFRASVCAFRVSELLVVRLSFVVKFFCLRCVSRKIPKFSCRVLKSSFSFEFVVEIFDSNFEFKFLEFSCRISNSTFSFRCSIRLLEFRCSIRFLESRFSMRVSSSSSLIFRVEFVVEIFDVLIYSTSRSSLLYSTSRIRFLEFRVFDSSSLIFEFVFFVVLIYSTSRICRRNCCFRTAFDDLNFSSNFATFVARRLKSPIFMLNCELTSSIILARTLTLRSRCHSSFARAFRA